jgi:hydrogenase maturation factor HypE
MNLSNKIREFAMENEVVIRYENLKAYIKENSKNPKFLLSFSSDKNLTDDLRDYFEKERQKIENLAENIKKAADEAQEKINTIKDNFNK